MKALHGLLLVAMSILLPGASAPSDTVVLKFGETVKIEDLSVGFKSLVGDSRCARGVVCVWEGDAAVLLSADASGVEPGEYELHTHQPFGNTFTYAGRRITLVRVDPYPVIDVPVDPGTYVVTLRVESATTTPATPRTWGSVKTLYR